MFLICLILANVESSLGITMNVAKMKREKKGYLPISPYKQAAGVDIAFLQVLSTKPSHLFSKT